MNAIYYTDNYVGYVISLYVIIGLGNCAKYNLKRAIANTSESRNCSIINEIRY